MRKLHAIAAVAFAAVLVGCGTHVREPLPPAQVAGPKSSKSEFVCSPKVAPLDRNHRTAADINKYEDRLEYRGDVCSQKLNSVGPQARRRRSGREVTS